MGSGKCANEKKGPWVFGRKPKTSKHMRRKVLGPLIVKDTYKGFNGDYTPEN